MKADLQYMTSSGYTTSASGMITSVHNSTGSSTSNGIFCLTNLAQGVIDRGRIGNNVRFLRMSVRGLTYNGAAQTTGSGGTLPTLWRIIFFSVRANNASALATGPSDITSLLQDFSSATMNPCLAAFNPETVPSRARIIKDILINPFPVNATTSGLIMVGKHKTWRFSVSLSKHFRMQPTTYNGTAAGATGCEMNHVFAAFIQSPAVPGDPGSAISQWTVKLSFLP